MGLTVAVVSACSGRKARGSVVDCAGIDANTRADLVATYRDASLPARELYTGDEHRHVRAAVDQLAAVADVEWRIVSAGFGLVTPATVLPSYECTFRDRDSVARRVSRLGHDPDALTHREQLRTLGAALDIPGDLTDLFDDSIDLAFVVLGTDYLAATGDSLETLPDACTTFAFAAASNQDDIGACEWVPSTDSERAALETTWTRLKGLQLRNVAESIDTTEELRALDGASAVTDRAV